MKKTKKLLALLVSVAMIVTFVPAVSWATTSTNSGTKATSKTATVTVNAMSKNSVDLVAKKVTATDDLTETYYPKIVEPTGVVTVSDAIVAAHIAKYGDAFKANPTDYYEVLNGEYGVMIKKQFKRTQVGMYYINNKGITVNVGVDTVKDGDVVGVMSYESDYNDLYSYFDKNAYTASVGQKIKVKIGVDNFGTALTPSSATLATVNASTGVITEMSGVTTDASGIASVSFSKPGTYYITAKGSITYAGWSGEVTGGIACPIAKVTVDMAAPKTISATGSGWNATKVKWSTVTGATSYQLYRATSKNGAYKKVKTTSKKTFTDKNIKTGKTYYYKVRGTKETTKGNFSKVCKAKATAAAPTLKLAAGKNMIKATWSKTAGATGYKLYRATAKNGKYTVVRTAKGVWNREYTSINKKSGKKYFYKIKAYKTVSGKNVYSQTSHIKMVTAK